MNPVIVDGRCELLLPDEAIHAFTRTSASARLLVMLNSTAGTPGFALPKGCRRTMLCC